MMGYKADMVFPLERQGSHWNQWLIYSLHLESLSLHDDFILQSNFSHMGKNMAADRPQVLYLTASDTGETLPFT